MRLTKWGLEITMAYKCNWCGAKPGELCGMGPFTGAAKPWQYEHAWEHGVHYGRESGGDSNWSVEQHISRPRIPVDGTEPGFDMVMLSLLRNAT